MTASSARRTHAVEETERLGEVLAPALRVGDVLALRGPLGAGKTRFVAGLARGLSTGSRVRSPTYTLVNEYLGRIALVHLDLYRVETHDVEALGIDEYLDRGALAVEWGEKLPTAWSRDALTLTFTILSAAEREIAATAQGDRGAELLGAWEGLRLDPARARSEGRWRAAGL